MKLKGKKLTSALVLLSFIGYMPLSTSMAMANVDANAMFKTEYSINGSTSIVDITSPITNQAGKEMQAINQAGNSGVAIFGLSGDLGANNGLNSVKTAGSQTSVFNFIGDGPTHINGYIKDSCVGDCVGNAATGRDVFINAAGIMFGEGSRVNLNSATFSTSGINGLSNEQIEALKGMSASERAAYLKPFATNMTFIGNPTGTASITGTSTDIYADKSLAFVSNNVNFKDSLLRTNLAFNYGGGNDGVHNQSFSNLKIVTADGVNFQYLNNGAIKTVAAAESDAAKDTAKNITLDNTTVESGSVYVQNANTNADSKINVKNSVIRGVKLVSKAGNLNERGDIYIVGANDINIEDSKLTSHNMSEQYAKDADGNFILDKNGNKIQITSNTHSFDGGTIRVKAGKNATIKNSNIASTYSTKNYQTNDANGNKVVGSGAGDIAITANNGDATIENSKVLSKGDLTIAAAAKVNAKDAVIQAKNNYDTDSTKKTISITGAEGVSLDNTYSESTSSTIIYSPKTIDLNKSTVYAKKDLELLADETNITDTVLAYSGLNLIKDDSLLNDVTIKGSTTLLDTDSNDLVVKTNGNLVVDNNKLQKRGFKSTITNDFNYSLELKEASNQDSITLESTKGSVTVKNGSDVATANGDITLNAKDSANGETFINGSKLTAKGNININQAKTHKTGVNLTKDSTLNAGKNINITTTNNDADIIADQNDFATLNYADRLTLNAGKDVVITGSKDGGMTLNKVDFNAKNNNTVTYNSATPADTNNLVISNSTFNGKSNTIASNANTTLKDTVLNGEVNDVAGLFDVNLNNVEIKAKDAAAPENTKTNVRAGKNLTTNNTVLKVNGTKLIADSNKEMNLVVAGVNNKKAGLEINTSERTNGIQGTTVNKTNDVELYSLKDTKVTVNAADDVLAISKIKAGDLNLDANDSFLAAITDLTADETAGVTGDTTGKAYIEVANFGKFNLDPMETFDDYAKQPTDFTYGDHFVKGTTETPAGTEIETYKKHFIEFDNNGTLEQFLLVYDKPVTGCDEPPVVPDTPFNPFEDETSSMDNLSSLIEQMRLPRQLEPTSNQAPVANNTTDPTSGIVSAAAKIEVANTNNDKEDEFEI